MRTESPRASVEQPPRKNEDLEPLGHRLLRCQDLGPADRTAVDGVSFHLAPGEIYGLLGPNGAGKTTTIKMVCGLLRPDAGSIMLDGHSAISDLATRSMVGYVPQDVALYPDLTAAENLSFSAASIGSAERCSGPRRRGARAHRPHHRRNDRVESYSGGMKRRLNIAAGLLHHPKLLVLDEPIVGVDLRAEHAILERVRVLGRGGMSFSTPRTTWKRAETVL